MTTMASQIPSLTVVYSTVYSDEDQRKHQSSASLAFVWGIHRDRWIPRTKGQLRGKSFHLMTSSCYHYQLNRRWSYDMDKWLYAIILYAYDYLSMLTFNAGLANSSEYNTPLVPYVTVQLGQESTPHSITRGPWLFIGNWRAGMNHYDCELAATTALIGIVGRYAGRPASRTGSK